MKVRRLFAFTASILVSMLVLPVAEGVPERGGLEGWRRAHERLEQRFGSEASATRAPAVPVATNFELVGHADLGETDTNGDVWVHESHAYIGTWSDPCNGLGVKVIDISTPANPTMIGRVAGIPGTSAEDVVVRSVSTASFTGDLLAAGIQRCGEDSGLDDDPFGVDLWDVSDPANPVHLTHFGVVTGFGGVHELDLVQRGANVYAILATPWSEWFDESQDGDVWIVDVTNPTAPSVVGTWGAAEEGLSRGPFDGQGSFGSMFGHSVRANSSGTQVYASYWDAGVVTLDVSDPSAPTMIGRTEYPADAEGETHSMTPYGGFLLVNDEDFDTRSPATIVARGTRGVASEAPYAPPLWRSRGHAIGARVVRPAGQGCSPSDYAGRSAEDRIAVVKTFFSVFDEDSPTACLQTKQARVAERMGAIAVVHDWISRDTSPQWFSFKEVGIPVLFTDHATARAMVRAGRARLVAQRPAWGFLRVFDATTGEEVATFDDLPYVRRLQAPVLGDWSIHNTEVRGDVAYSSWYSHGVVALDLSPLAASPPGDPTLVGQFVPDAAASSPTQALLDGVPEVWGVYVRQSDGLVFLSDMTSGLWIIRPTGPALP